MLFKLVGICVGVVVMFWGINENKLNQNMTDEPEKVTMAQLEKGDYDGSYHVEISDFVYVNYHMVYQAKVGKFDKDVKASSAVNHVYVPIVSTEHKFVSDVGAFFEEIEKGNMSAPEPELSEYTVLIKSNQFKTVGDLPEDEIQVAGEPVTGILINKISSPSHEEKELLRSGCPGIDLEKVLILDQGRTPSSSVSAYAGIIGGPVISLIFVVLLFKKRKPAPVPAQQGVQYQ